MYKKVIFLLLLMPAVANAGQGAEYVGAYIE